MNIPRSLGPRVQDHGPQVRAVPAPGDGARNAHGLPQARGGAPRQRGHAHRRQRRGLAVRQPRRATELR